MRNATLARRSHTAAVVACAVGVFAANAVHAAQQSIFDERVLVLARNLAAGHGFRYAPGEPGAVYPLWGYAALTVPGVWLGAPRLWLALLQLAMALAGGLWFVRWLAARGALPHPLVLAALIAPFAAVLSVRWPDAPVAALMLIVFAQGVRAATAAYRGAARSAVTAAGALALAAQLRPEVLALPVFAVGAAALPVARGLRWRLVALGVVLGLVAGASLLPWALHARAAGAGLRLTSTNGPMVLYVALGQLPHNPWGIVPEDATAIRRARELGARDPFTPRGSRLLAGELRRAILAHPAAFVTKLAWNAARAVGLGVYVGEYYRWVLDRSALGKLKRAIRARDPAAAWRAAGGAPGVGLLALTGLLRAASALALLWMLWTVGRAAWRPLAAPLGAAVCLALALAVYRVGIAALALYEPRVMAQAWLPLAAVALAVRAEGRASTETPSWAARFAGGGSA